MQLRPGPVATIFAVALLAPAVFAASAGATTWAEGPSGEGLSPLQLHAAYEMPFETPSAYEGMPPGTEPIVALIDAGSDPPLEENLGVYSETFGLPACTESNGCLRVVNEDGNPGPLPPIEPPEESRAGETDLDVEVAHAVCPACRLLVVEGDIEGSGEKAIRTTGKEVRAAVAAGATAVSISIGLYAKEEEAEEEEFLEEIERTYFDHPGVVIAAAAGDCGYEFEVALSGLPDEIGCGESGPFYPSFPAKLGSVIAVGGTKLTEVGGAWKSKAWFDGGSGCAAGVSTPPWQAALAEWPGAGCAGRAVADVAADASCQTGPEIYVANYAHPEEEWGIGCGTSAATPILAAEFALAGGARGRARPAETLYEHAGQASAFYDVTEGRNGIGCEYRIECQAWPGWDEPTGLGSPVGLSAFALPGAPVNVAPPAIAGSPQVGGTLVLQGGGWDGGPTVTFEEWQECEADGSGCAPIMGATASTHTVTQTELGKTIRVVETAGDDSGYSPPAVSKATSVVTVTPGAVSGAPGAGSQGSGAPSGVTPHQPSAVGRARLSVPRPLRFLPGARVAVVLHCPSAAAAGCEGAIDIRTPTREGPRLLGHTRYRMGSGATLRLRVRLRDFVRTLLERERHLSLTITASGTDGERSARHAELRSAGQRQSVPRPTASTVWTDHRRTDPGG